MSHMEKQRRKNINEERKMTGKYCLMTKKRVSLRSESNRNPLISANETHLQSEML